MKNKTKSGLLIIHGITTGPGSSFSNDISAIKNTAAEMEILSYELAYQGRGTNVIKRDEEGFNIDVAVTDVLTTIEYLTNDTDGPQITELTIITRGYGAYIALSATKKKLKIRFNIVLWQPVFFPRRVMERRGHLNAFNNAYKRSSHKYVKIGQVNFYQSFFEKLPEDDTVYGFLRDDIPVIILATKHDKVATEKDIEEFVSEAPKRCSNIRIIGPEWLDSCKEPKDHLSFSSAQKFIEETEKFIRKIKNKDL